MKILLLVQNLPTSNVKTNDITTILYNLNRSEYKGSGDFFVLDNDDSLLIKQDLTCIVNRMINYADFEDIDNELFDELYRSMYQLIAGSCKTYIVNYHLRYALQAARVCGGNLIYIEYVSNDAIMNKLYNDKEINDTYDLIYRIKVCHFDLDDKNNKFDIILNTTDGLRDLSIQFDILMNKIKEDYSNV